MPTVHVVQQGEYLASIARRYHKRRWQGIYFHPDNTEFRRKRPNPNVIHPGDEIVIPDLEERIESCATDRRHTFRVDSSTVQLRIVVRDDAGQVVADEPYVLKVGGEEHRGKTDARGRLERRIPVGVCEGELRLLRKNAAFPLAIGHLDPIDDVEETPLTGVQARLNNLGFFCGAVDNVKGPKTTAAIRNFQRQVLGRAEPDGVLDAQTRDALIRQHGC